MTKSFSSAAYRARFNNNAILKVDSYKPSHHPEYPEGMTWMQSYLESRGGLYPYTAWFGLQAILKLHLCGEVVTEEHVEEATEFYGQHFGRGDVFDKKGWMRIPQVHGGRLPLEIRSALEGTIIPTRNVLMTVASTDPEIPSLTNFEETLGVQVWYPTTVCTQDRIVKQGLMYFYQQAGAPLPDLNFKLHDFGCRGVSSMESAAIGGAAHLVNFMGSDTVPAIRLIRDLYGCPMAGYSIPATEHSTITSWGEENECQAYDHWLELWPTGIIACVIDSYDDNRAVSEYFGKVLRDKVLARDGVLVLRPDSGDPVVTVLRILDLAGQAFGYTTNEKGYRVLNNKVRVIQGDGVNPKSIMYISMALAQHKWSPENLAFGMGGALLQHVDRDGLRFAFKCNLIKVNGVERTVLKHPKSDFGGSKASKGGHLKLVMDEHGVLQTHTSLDTPSAIFKEMRDELVTVYRDGELLVDQTFDEIRERAEVKPDDAKVLVSMGS